MLLINSKGSKKNEGIAVLQNPIKNILNFSGTIYPINSYSLTNHVSGQLEAGLKNEATTKIIRDISWDIRSK